MVSLTIFKIDWWKAESINGSLSVSFLESESYSLHGLWNNPCYLPCTKHPAIFFHNHISISIPETTTKCFNTNYNILNFFYISLSINFSPIKGRWSKKISYSLKFLAKFQQSLPYIRRSQVINNVSYTHLKSHLIHNHHIHV